MKLLKLSIPAALAVLTVNIVTIGMIFYAVYAVFGLSILLVMVFAKAIAMLTPIYHAYEVKPVEPNEHPVKE